MALEFSRRNFIKKAVALIGAQALPADAMANQRYQFDRIPVSTDHLNPIIDNLIAGLKKSAKASKSLFPTLAPTGKSENDLRKYLLENAYMAIPSKKEVGVVKQLSDTNSNGEKDKDLLGPLEQLSQNVVEGKYGLYLLGDLQNLYLVKKMNGMLEFVRVYDVSTSSLPYSNDLDSGGTPLGMHRVGKGKNISQQGLLAEVVSVLNPHQDEFLNMTLEGENKVRTFARHLNGRDTFAEMTTARLLVIGAKTPLSRGANLHGTNFQNRLGTRDSSGCARLSNVSIMDLLGSDADGVSYIEDGVLSESRGKWEIKGGTPLMIYASPKERGMKPNGEKPVQQKIPDWVRELNKKK